MKTRGTAALQVIVAWALLPACAATVSDGEATTEDQDVSLSEQRQSLWRIEPWLWDGPSVPVCWENPSAMADERRQAVRAAIARTWSFAGNLEFTGWGTCAPSTPSDVGLRIYVADVPAGPAVNWYEIGKQLSGKQHGLVLADSYNQFQFTAEATGLSTELHCAPDSTPAELKTCAENIAIHEFGHVLGFAHENNYLPAMSEPDYPADCASRLDSSEAEGTSLFANDWDLDSVMNYCNPRYGGRNLSRLDFAGTQDAYGTSPRFVGALVAAGII